MADVVHFPSPSLLLRELIGSGGRGVITTWLAKHPGARAKFRIRIKKLQMVSRIDWNKKQFRYLEAGLAEIKWEWGKKEWRAIGFDHKGYFVMVLGCTHKDRVYDPVDWLKTSKLRKGEAERG